MQVEFEKIAEYMGELYAAAQLDLRAAELGAVGLNGMPVAGWREAYLEGIKDLAEGIVTRSPVEYREAMRLIVTQTCERIWARSAESDELSHLKGEQANGNT